MGGKNLVPNGDVVFDHKTRKMIYSHILNYPGVSYITLKNIFHLSASTLRYHLEYLAKADRILMDLEDGKRCYYPLKDELLDSKLYENGSRSFKFSSIQKRIITMIRRHPGITQKKLIKKTGLSRFTVSYNMKKFVDMGMVKKSNSSKFVRYEYMTDDQLRHEVLLRLTIKLLNKEITEKEFLKLKDKLVVNENEGS